MKTMVLIASMLVALTFTATAAISEGGSSVQSAGHGVAIVDVSNLDAATSSATPPTAEDTPMTRADEPGTVGLLGGGFGMVLLALLGRRKWRLL